MIENAHKHFSGFFEVGVLVAQLLPPSLYAACLSEPSVKDLNQFEDELQGEENNADYEEDGDEDEPIQNVEDEVPTLFEEPLLWGRSFLFGRLYQFEPLADRISG